MNVIFALYNKETDVLLQRSCTVFGTDTLARRCVDTFKNDLSSLHSECNWEDFKRVALRNNYVVNVIVL